MADNQPTVTRRTAIAAAVLVVVAGVLGGVLLDRDPPEPDPAEPSEGASVVVTGNTTVTVTYTTESGEQETVVVEDVPPELSDSQSGWAFLDRSAVPAELRTGAHSSHVAPLGGRVLVGNLTSTTRPVAETTVRVVAPAGDEVDPVRKSHFISEFLSPYRLGSNRTAVTLVAAPDTFPHEGLMYRDGTGYVTIDAFWDGDVGSPWLHEVLHAKQTFTVAPEMAWVREASAEYLTYRAMAEQYEEVTDGDVRARLDALPAHHEASLSDQTTWDGEAVDDTKGVRLLYAIDADLRASTDGKRTLFDVVRTMNQRDHTITVGEFQRIVESYTGDDEAWIRRAITEPGPVGPYDESAGSFDGA